MSADYEVGTNIPCDDLGGSERIPYLKLILEMGDPLG